MITYCFDSSLSPKLAMSMRILLPEPDDEPIVVPHDIMHVSEVEGVHIGDPLDVLIPKLAELEYTLVTCVTASKRKQINQALADAGLRVVYLADRFASLPEFPRAARLLECWEKIVKASFRLERGKFVSVALNGVAK